MTAVASRSQRRGAAPGLRTGARRRAIPAVLALMSFGLALAQSPGQISFETKVDLHLEPLRFLGSVLSAWSPTGDLGHVQSGQYVGYLFPMGPFFAIGRLLGLPDWLVDRLWLGAVLAIGAWGVVRLIDALLARSRGVEHVVAGLAYVLNPYVVTIGNRTTIFLVAYAALPWMLLAVHRGVHNPRGWRWPAALALLLAASGGGVNAATVAWVLVAPALLLLYEVAVIGVRRAAAIAFTWRAALASVAASLWWIGGVLIGSAHGTNFLPFIEQPGTIWQTTSVPEVLRGMGYWVSYAGVAFVGHALPLQSSSSTMLFTPTVVVASLLVPALAVAGFLWTRRWRYGPFLLTLVLVGVVIVAAGFPEGTPLRQGLHFVYNRAQVVQFLRTSYKAAPLIMLGVAGLLGAACGEAWRRLQGRWRRAVLLTTVAGLLALAAWPLTSGDAIGLRSRGVPSAWRQAAADLDRQLPANSRAIVLPSQLFSYYTWGGTVDPVLPVLSSRPIAQRSITPWANLHSTDLLWTVDRLVQQQRLYPGELRPLLSLMGVRAVVSGTDDDRLRSGSVDPTTAASELAAQGLGQPARTYGPSRTFVTPPDQVYPAMRLPEVRRYDLSSSAGMVGVRPAGPPTIIDGSAEGLAGLAAFGGLAAQAPMFYAGDLSGAKLSALTAGGAQVVITDSNRRRVFVNSLADQNLGPTVGANDSFSADAAILDPFAARGSDDQTVQFLKGASYIRAPYSPGFVLFPEHRPFAAFDSSPSTAWLADHSLDPLQRWIEVGFTSPRDVPFIDILPYNDSRATVHAVEVAGRRFAVHPGWNHLVLDLRNVRALRVRMAAVGTPHDVPGGAGGLAEIRVPGLHVSEALRAPVLAEHELAGHDLGHVGLTYLFERTTGDDPLHRMRGHGAWQAGSTRDAGDGETGLARLFTPPAARSWSAGAWLSLSPLTLDSELDRLAGYPGPVVADSSGRFLNEGRFRASSAFDGAGSTAWVGELDPGSRPWIEWQVPRPATVSRLQLTVPAFPVQVPARVALSVDGRAGAVAPVSPDGSVRFLVPLYGRRFRLEVLKTRVPPEFASAGVRARRAVGIGEIEGAGVERMIVPRRGPLHAGCGIAAFTVGGRRVALRVIGGVPNLDRGGALRATQCSPPVALASGLQLLTAGSGVFRFNWLRLGSPAPAGIPAASGGGRVLDAGHIGRTSVTGVRVELRDRSWLVLGESYDSGWRASCDGRSLGSPVVIDGYANGWSAPAGCQAVSFTFAPQRTMVWLYALSAAVAIACLALLLFRRAPASAPPEAARLPVAARRPRVPTRAAIGLGLLAGVVLGFIFSIRSGLVIGPVVAVIAGRGISVRALILAAGALLVVVVPAIYLLDLPPNQGGYDFTYAIDLIAAHWVGVAAIVLLVVALARTLIEARVARGSPDHAS
ncbi:MAG TPA: alpha-(1-_3)-arabinofuranosyltransferase family protein [Solirubrobacteraceae bacterium]